MSKLKTAFDVAVSLIMVAIAGFLVWPRIVGPKSAASTSLVIPTEPLDLTGRPAIGAGARVALLEFTDVQCPYCARFEQEIRPALEAEYVDKGLLTVYTLHFPLPSHPGAYKAAELAHCAHVQGKFRPVLSELFRLGRAFDDRSDQLMVASLGLGRQELDACQSSGAAKAVVAGDIELGRRLGVRGTPAFFLGLVQRDGRVRLSHGMAGLKPIPDFKLVIETLAVSATGK